MEDAKRDLDALPRYDRDEDAATVAARAASEPDPRVRAARLTALLSDTQSWVAWMSERRDQAVMEMRAEGDSYDDVARALGVSKSRAQQLCRRLLDRAARTAVSPVSTDDSPPTTDP